MSDLVVVATYLRRHEAEMAKGLLDSNGISCMISADDCGGWRPELSFGSAITLSVFQKDLQAAQEVLAQLPELPDH